MEIEPMIVGGEPFFKQEDLPRVKHYISNIIPKQEFWKEWTIIHKNFFPSTKLNGIVFNNVKDYNSGVMFVCVNLSESQNNTDIYVPLESLFVGIYVIFLTDKHNTLRYKLKPDCYKDLEPDFSAEIAGILVDCIKYSDPVISQDVHHLFQEMCSLASETANDDYNFSNIFINCYNDTIKIADKNHSFLHSYYTAFIKANQIVRDIEEKKTSEKLLSRLNSANSLIKIKQIVSEFNLNHSVNEYITSIMGSLSQFQQDIKTTKKRRDLFIKIITTNETITYDLKELQKILEKNGLAILYDCINKCLLSTELYVDINRIMSILQSVQESTYHSNCSLLINEEEIKSQELKNKIMAFQNAPAKNDTLKILMQDAHKFCCAENIEDQQVSWFKNLLETDKKHRLKARKKANYSSLIENIVAQLSFEDQYRDYLMKYPKILSRNAINLPEIIIRFVKFKFIDCKTVKENVIDFLQNRWDIQYWRLSQTLNTYKDDIREIISFHKVLSSNTDTKEPSLPLWPISQHNEPGVISNKTEYGILIEKLSKPLPSILEPQSLPYTIYELQKCHFSSSLSGTISTVFIQQWNSSLYSTYYSLQTKYDELKKANKKKMSTIINWVHSSKQPTFANFYQFLGEMVIQDNKPFTDDIFKEFVQKVLVVQNPDAFDDLAKLVKSDNHKIYDIVKKFKNQVYLKKTDISAQKLVNIAFASLLQQTYDKLKKWKVFEGVFNSLGKNYGMMATEFNKHYYPDNILGDIKIKIVEEETNIEVSQINGTDFRRQPDNIQVALSAIYRYDRELFINFLLPFINHQKNGMWNLTKPLPEDVFQSQLPNTISFDDINNSVIHVIVLFITVTFMLFSNKDIVNIINSSFISEEELLCHIKHLTNALHNFIKPYFLIKENVQTPVHFTTRQTDSLNIQISSIYKQTFNNNNVDFPLKDNYDCLFNFVIANAQQHNIELDIKFFINTDQNNILCQYAQLLQNTNSSCIMKLHENVVLNKNQAFAYICDSYMIYCNEEIQLYIDPEVFENISLYRCVYMNEIDNPLKNQRDKINPFTTASIIAQPISCNNEDYFLFNAMSSLSLDETDTTIIEEEVLTEEKQNLIAVIQNDSLQDLQRSQDNLIPQQECELPEFIYDNQYIFDDELSSKPYDSDFLRNEVNQIIQNILEPEIIPNEDINTLSVNDSIATVPCVVSINNPLINKQTTIKSSAKEYVPIILCNRDRDIVKHLLAMSHFNKLRESILKSN